MKKKLFIWLMMIPLLSLAQTKITGKVLSNNNALPGVNVLEKGTSNGTSTDIDGNYSITVSNNATLVFSFVGYKTQEVKVNDNTININLEEDASQLDAVVVQGFSGVIGQARRRAESIQSIPESVVTFTSEQIEATGVSNLETFASQVPNLSFSSSQNVGVNFITVRGIPQIRNGDAPISFVVDGVTIPDANLFNQELFDLAMIEIVKGPQGALYGKNAIGGAINVVTQQPTNISKNRITLGYGNGNTIKAQGAFSGPISKDKVFYRVSGSYKQSDGFFFNTTNQTEPDYYDDINFRGQLKFNLSDNFTATVSGQYSNLQSGALYYHIPTNGNTSIETNNFDDLAAESDVLGDAFVKNFFGYLKLEYDLGNATLQSVTSYNDAKRNHEGDLDHSSFAAVLQYQDSDSKVFNQEVRVSSKDSDSPFSWDVGGFYQKNERYLNTIATLADNSPLLSNTYTNSYNTFAAFAFLDFKATDRLTLSLGLRYDNDEIEQENSAITNNLETSASEFQPKFSVAFKATENMMMYANYGRGYRAGGFNGNNTALFDQEFRPETSNNYEIGVKTNWWNDRLILNVAGFYIDFNDQQQYGVSVSPPDILLGNYNYVESEVRGFEADLKLRTSEYLDILVGYGAVRSVILDGGMAGTTDRSAFNNVETPFIPQQNYNFALQSNFPISENIDFNGFLTLKGTGQIYWHEDTDDVSPGYELLDGRLGFSINNKFDINLWGSNILDEKYALEHFSSSSAGGGGQDLVWLGRPATYGIDLIFKF